MVKVQLAVYDLSNGMASAMSESILGKRIDGIWHTGTWTCPAIEILLLHFFTGILVYEREYFFGGGIQSLPLGAFARSHGNRPVQILDMGDTALAQDLFHDFLSSIQSRFTAATYDLLRNNCNNFSNECCHFLTGALVSLLPASVYN